MIGSSQQLECICVKPFKDFEIGGHYKYRYERYNALSFKIRVYFKDDNFNRISITKFMDHFKGEMKKVTLEDFKNAMEIMDKPINQSKENPTVMDLNTGEIITWEEACKRHNQKHPHISEDCAG
jgi:hypothetical protein